MKAFARPVVLAAAVVLGAAILAVASTARGASDRAQVAGIDVTQTCPNRVQPRSRIDITATVSNTGVAGDDALAELAIDADAGTPDNTSDDFVPTYQGGDANGNSLVDPGEHWLFAGSYTAPAEDVVNTVGVDAVTTPGGANVSDLAPCVTDVVQQAQPGVIVGVQAVSGKVLFRKPGSNTFVELKGETEIPVGSQVNTLKGTVSLTAGLGGGRTNTAQFNAGLFTILQRRAVNAVTTLRLDGGNFRVCARRSSTRALSLAAKSRRPVRRLWGNGKGRFTTRGRYSSATVRGTKWLVQDQCNGTLTRVLRGIVRVQDFRRHKTVNVRAGRTYLARAPGA